MSVDTGRFDFDDDTIAVGRANIAKIRKQMDLRRPSTRTQEPRPEQESADRDDRPDDVNLMAAQMAAGAERDRLADRVAELEGENRRLRRALAAVQRAAAEGISPDSDPGSTHLASSTSQQTTDTPPL